MAAPVFGRSDSQVFLHVLGKERDVRELERDGYFLDAFVGIPQFVDDAFDGIFMNQCQCILPAHLLDDTGQVFGGIVELFGIIRQGTVLAVVGSQRFHEAFEDEIRLVDRLACPFFRTYGIFSDGGDEFGKECR